MIPPQQSLPVRGSEDVLHPAPPHWAQPVVQQTTSLPSTPAVVPSLHVLGTVMSRKSYISYRSRETIAVYMFSFYG